MTTIEFRAPWGRALRIVTLVSVALLSALMIGGAIALARNALLAGMLMIVIPAVTLLGALPFMVRGYVLNEQSIVVERLGWKTVLPLQGLQSVSGNAEAMHGSLRVLGNGGLFSFSGEFWNRKLGRYRALATDPDRAVVLRYPKRVVVITPHDPQQFIMRARSILKFADSPFSR